MLNEYQVYFEKQVVFMCDSFIDNVVVVEVLNEMVLEMVSELSKVVEESLEIVKKLVL